MNRIKRILNKVDQLLQKSLEKLNLKWKMTILYLGCVLVPLIFTDTFILFMIVHSERENMRHEMENVVNAVEYYENGGRTCSYDRKKYIYEPVYQ